MGIILLGASSGNGLEVDVDNRGLFTPRAPSKNSLGSYRMNMESGAIAATLAAASPLFSFRYAGANLAILNFVRVSVVISTAITTAVPMSLEAVAARGFTASDTGGTSATLTANNGKDRTSDGTTAIGDLRIASTAALGAGTRVLDAQGFAGVNYGSGTAVGSTALPIVDLYNQDSDTKHAVIFANNEGFIIRNPDAGPATGAFKLMVSLGWIEVLAATFKP